MPGRIRRRGVGALGAALLLGAAAAGCSSDDPDPVPAPPGPRTSAAPPVGSVARPRPVTCRDGATSAPARTKGTASAPPSKSTSASGRPAPTSPSPSAQDWTQNDIDVGPLTLRGLRALADGNPYTHGVRDSAGWHYVITAAVRAGAEVTVTVGAEERARAGLEYGGGEGVTPAPAVTFHGCPGGATDFMGAFFIAGSGKACLPLEIRAGDGPAQRVVISFYNGRCPA